MAWFTTDWICWSASPCEAGTVTSVAGKVTEPDALLEDELEDEDDPEPDPLPDPLPLVAEPLAVDPPAPLVAPADAELPADAPEPAAPLLPALAVCVAMLPADAVFALLDELLENTMIRAMTTARPTPAPISTPGFG